VTFWYVLAAAALQQMVFFGMFVYLAAYLIETYRMPAGDTALPLALAGSSRSCLSQRPCWHRSRHY
jgi:hypothetical protein